MGGGWGPYEVVVHVCSAGEVYTSVIGPLDLGGDYTLGDMGSVVDLVILRHQAIALTPIVRLLRPIRVRLIAGVSCEPRTQMEKQTVGDRVLVVVALVRREDLPSQSTATRSSIPAPSLSVEHCLCQGKPLRFILGRVGVSALSGGHGGNAPEGLIVVSESERLIRGLVVFVGADLEQHGFCYDAVKSVVISEEPIVYPGLMCRLAA